MSLKHYAIIQKIVDRENRVLSATDILDALQDGSILEGYSQDVIKAAYNLIMKYRDDEYWCVFPAIKV